MKTLRGTLSVTTLLAACAGLACGGAPFQALEPLDAADAAAPLPELEASVGFDATGPKPDAAVGPDACSGPSTE